MSPNLNELYDRVKKDPDDLVAMAELSRQAKRLAIAIWKGDENIRRDTAEKNAIHQHKWENFNLILTSCLTNFVFDPRLHGTFSTYLGGAFKRQLIASFQYIHTSPRIDELGHVSLKKTHGYVTQPKDSQAEEKLTQKLLQIIAKALIRPLQVEYFLLHALCHENDTQIGITLNTSQHTVANSVLESKQKLEKAMGDLYHTYVQDDNTERHDVAKLSFAQCYYKALALLAKEKNIAIPEVKPDTEEEKALTMYQDKITRRSQRTPPTARGY
jgi:hypothetical protein